MLIFFVLLFCEVSAQGEQVSNYFLDHLLKLSKSQNLFLTVCSSWASLNFIFWSLLKVSRYSILFFEACSRWAGIQFYFLEFAQDEQMPNFIFRGLLKWNGRGGACVPARTSVQRRFHTKMARFHVQTACFHPRMRRCHVQTTCFHQSAWHR